jgi:hypothetical protein
MPLVNPVPAFDFTVIFMNASSSAVGGAVSAVALERGVRGPHGRLLRSQRTERRA